MSSRQHFLLTTVVSHRDWASARTEVLAGAHATLRERARQRGLHLAGEPTHTVEVLHGSTHVRVTVTAEGAPEEPAG